MLELIQTADGSNTIYNSEVGENYHSRHGALQESKHVFVNSGLSYYLDNNNLKEVSILEVGFGTGLNFLLSADFCTEQNIHLDYTGIEAYPLNKNMIDKTGYDQYITAALWDDFINSYSASLLAPVQLNPNCGLYIANCQLLNFQSDKKFDVIYFDAFAAVHQPEMWNEEAISHTIKFLKPGGVFVTYAITGNLKRMLKGLGLQIQKIPGAAGKREMLRAIGCADMQM
ncbi:tRNA (5-methylaminomethyl-2-thiouridine)(34)-methyltransferase MnmD [Mucilaginibacter sp.]|uniref:tRNA (5-methylaminomethyl-2-thiouridine)(34)-methyltransferase MnmD n=1 Tax=Mucilaginibacter sp. TaxID=1882438 RepID=UPI00260CF797|nr:tRNA (5-methylaminomethyl-2-thiouridine)(34)-methyltransferase MnmD [Mucilaginibacter sp.]MDB5029612.1 tRNA (5-methylaminomethyl-2-thiouridylate)-methyltransferase [Mucilaginibacter sp.]